MNERPSLPMPLPAAVLIEPKYAHNLAAAIRACSCFGVQTLLWTGQRFAFEAGDRLPREERMKGYADVRVRNCTRPFDVLAGSSVTPIAHLHARGGSPVCVELTRGATPLDVFVHPARAVYLFGPEDGHVPQSYRALCHHFVYIPSRHCLNLAAALNVVLYDRAQKSDARYSTAEYERRGIDVPGWDGQ